MSSIDLKKTVPTSRFPEFQDTCFWKPRKIGEFLEESRLKGSAGNVARKLTVKLWGRGVAEKQEKQLGSVNTQYYRRSSGQLIYSKLDFLNGAFGLIPDDLDGYESTVDLPCFDFKGEIEPLYLLKYVQREAFFKLFGEIADGGRKAKRIQPEIFFEMPILVPPTLEEQRKISRAIGSIDDLIDFEDCSLDGLREHKQALLQRLMPYGKSELPENRFPKFQNRKPFKTTKLSDLLAETKTRNRDGRYGKEHVLSVSGEYGCVNQIEHLGRSYAGASVENYHVVETSDIVYTKSPLKSSPFGIIKENKGEAGIVSTLYAVYRSTGLSHPSYLDHYFSNAFNLNSYLQPLVNKGAKNDMKVKNSDVLTGQILVPEIDEQEVISDCLSSLDELISAKKKLIYALSDKRLGVTQALLPSPVGTA